MDERRLTKKVYEVEKDDQIDQALEKPKTSEHV
jgi:hypothetical protein